MDVHHVPEISQQLLKTRSQFLHYTCIKLFIIFESLLGKYVWNNTKIQKKSRPPFWNLREKFNILLRRKKKVKTSEHSFRIT